MRRRKCGDCLDLVCCRFAWYRLSFRRVGRKLTTQTSVVNGTAEAEHISVDRVCDAGGEGGEDSSMARLQAR